MTPDALPTTLKKDVQIIEESRGLFNRFGMVDELKALRRLLKVHRSPTVT
jgi:hypothetical protein